MSTGRESHRAPRLDLLYEARDLVVINKPAGLLTMPSAPGRAEHEDSVLARARAYARHKLGRRWYAGLLHRLDRGTSGALAIALSPAVHTEGRSLFKAHAFERTYLALVRGSPAADTGTIDRPIAEAYTSGRRRLAEPGEPSLPARTHYQVRERFGRDASLLEVTLDTGRQHQIRLHLSSIGHPVVGDRVYGEGGSADRRDRPMLHAWRLAFPHPISQARIEVEAPVPPDFTRAARMWRQRLQRA
ncbi:MAG: RluA family pseudouridine synthase [Vicinamibacterales bacterium]